MVAHRTFNPLVQGSSPWRSTKKVELEKGMRLSTLASVRRLARMWVDLSTKRQNELLEKLDSESRQEVVKRINEIKNERRKRCNKDDA